MDCALLLGLFIIPILVQEIKCSSSHIESIPVCSPTGGDQEPIHLSAHGFSSSAYVLLRDIDVDATNDLQWLPPPHGRLVVERSPPTCRLKVTAPPGHVVYVAVLETRLEIRRALIVHQEERDAKCPLNIFLPDTKSKSVYNANMCDMDPVADVPLLPSELEITWQLPPRSERADFEILTKDRMLLLTAVGKEATCRPPSMTGEVEGGSNGRSKYHTCMKIGWEPILCVSRDLMCNGEKNCPKGSTSSDEAPAICRAPQSFEDIARKLIQEFQLPLGFHEKWVESAKRQNDQTTTTDTSVGRKSFNNIWKKIEVSTRRSNYPHVDNDSTSTKSQAASTTTNSSSVTISTILNQYGPWGYLMLGMLICGGVLLLCGTWECCCRRPKPFLGGGHRNGAASSSAQMGHRTGATVLIINHGEESGVVGRPPEYEDLDQPPLYSALFPNNKAVTEPVIPMEERRPSQEAQQQQQQSSQLSRQNSTVTRSEVIVNVTAPKDDETSSLQNQNSSASFNVSASDSNAVDDSAGTTSSSRIVDTTSNDS